MQKILKSLLISTLFLTTSVYAHVTVKPSTAGVATYQIFSIAVPVEREIPTVSIRLVIPESLTNVSPNVKPGWKIEVKKNQKGNVTEILWTGGTIPEGQRDDFLFSAKTPAQPTALKWTAYQTYRDGTVISWDKNPEDQPKKENGEPDFSRSGPYSETKIVDDLTTKKGLNVPMAVSLVALIFSVASLVLVQRKRSL